MGTPAKYYTALHRGVDKSLTATEWYEISVEEYEIAKERFGEKCAIPPSKPKTISRRYWMNDKKRASYTPEQIVGVEKIERKYTRRMTVKEKKPRELTLMDKFLMKPLVPQGEI